MNSEYLLFESVLLNLELNSILFLKQRKNFVYRAVDKTCRKF